jgi:hypothetical protein
VSLELSVLLVLLDSKANAARRANKDQRVTEAQKARKANEEREASVVFLVARA